MARFSPGSLHLSNFRRRFDRDRRRLQRSIVRRTEIRGAEYAAMIESAAQLCIGVHCGYFAELESAAILSDAREDLRPRTIPDLIVGLLEKHPVAARLMSGDWEGAVESAGQLFRTPSHVESGACFQSATLMLRPLTSSLSLGHFGLRLLSLTDEQWQLQLLRATRAADGLVRAIARSGVLRRLGGQKDFWPIDECVRFVRLMNDLGPVVADLESSAPSRALDTNLEGDCLRLLSATKRWRLDLSEERVAGRWEECRDTARTVLRQVEYALQGSDGAVGLSRARWTDEFTASVHGAEQLWDRLTEMDGTRNQRAN